MVAWMFHWARARDWTATARMRFCLSWTGIITRRERGLRSDCSCLPGLTYLPGPVCPRRARARPPGHRQPRWRWASPRSSPARNCGGPVGRNRPPHPPGGCGCTGSQSGWDQGTPHSEVKTAGVSSPSVTLRCFTWKYETFSLVTPPHLKTSNSGYWVIVSLQGSWHLPTQQTLPEFSQKPWYDWQFLAGLQTPSMAGVWVIHIRDWVGLPGEYL